VVYDPTRRTVFLHGGNAGIVHTSRSPGNSTEDDEGEEDGDVRMLEGRPEMDREGAKERRLDDFWCMTLRRWVLFLLSLLRLGGFDLGFGLRAVPEEVLRKATYRIRRQRFVVLS
jgi:hypothetical protein